jgi:hypothetical protein
MYVAGSKSILIKESENYPPFVEHDFSLPCSNRTSLDSVFSQYAVLYIGYINAPEPIDVCTQYYIEH